MDKIHILDSNVSNKIAAGEVVERPASVIKELVENSIDAGAASITVEIKNGGISYMRVTDNGCGMTREDAKVSFIRHATSKIIREDDLNNIKTLGFRGEALASIASVSHVEMSTKLKEETYGSKIIINGGEFESIEDCGCTDGTSIIVRNLFYNTPARLKFLKTESREGTIVSESLYSLALSKPSISFKYIKDGKVIFNTPGDGDLGNVVLTLYGKEAYGSLIKISYTGNILSIGGFIGNTDAARSNRNRQLFFVNGRFIKNKMLTAAVDNAYKTYLPISKFASCILFITIYPDLVDVNVHPTKSEVRFQDQKEVFSAVFNTVRNGLTGEVLIPDTKLKVEKKYDDDIEEKRVQVEMFPKDYSVAPRVKEAEYENTGINMEAPVKNIEYDTKNYEPINSVRVETDKPNIESVKNLLPPLIIIGQCCLTYILAQGPDGLYIIDQHAAHERILYEKFKGDFETSGVISQGLISPLLVELTQKERNIVKENIERFQKLGFELEYFGTNSVILRSVPVIFGEPQLKQLFIELIDLAGSDDLSGRSIIDKMLYTMACKSAVKANNRLVQKEMEEIVSGLRKINNPYTCPHGRPTIIKLTENELEKKFKRIQ